MHVIMLQYLSNQTPIGIVSLFSYKQSIFEKNARTKKKPHRKTILLKETET